MTQYFDDISLSPFKKEFAHYSFSTLKADIFAALSVSLLTLPQAMAYALVAGLPLSCGLFAAIFSPLLAAMFGSSRHLILGPVNSIAILIQYGVAEILFTHFRHLAGYEREIMAVNIVTQLALLVGIFQLIASFFKLGRLAQFVSYSVVIGYISGASLAILINQLYVLLGIAQPEGVHTLFEMGSYLVFHLKSFHLLTTGIGVFCVVMLLGFSGFGKKMPSALLTLVAASGGLYALGYLAPDFTNKVMLVESTGNMANLAPHLSLPYFNPKLLDELLVLAFAISLLSIMETSSISKTIAAKSGQRLSTDQEIFGLSLGNLVSCFVSAMPISASTSRSGVNYQSGAQTRIAAMFGALLVGIFVFCFGSVVTKIPLAALSSILIVTSFQLIDKNQLLLCLNATRADAFVYFATLFSCIFFSLDVALYIGVALSITFYLNKSAIPQLQQFTIDEEDRLVSLEKEMSLPVKIRLIKVKGELFFGAAEVFQRTLKSIAEDDTDTRVIILQLKNARDIDATACIAIKRLYEYLKNSGRHLILSGVTLPTWEVLSSSGLVDLIGKDYIFLIEEKGPKTYLQRAVKSAKELSCQTSASEGEKIIELQPELSKLEA